VTGEPIFVVHQHSARTAAVTQTRTTFS
jgi:hypothetical protein